jgi:hypothetical protein
LTAFQTINLGVVATAGAAWRGCRALPAFPSIDMPACKNFSRAWEECVSLAVFPDIDTSDGEDFSFAWYKCIALGGFTTVSRLSFEKATNMEGAFLNCESMASFPAGMFDGSKCRNYRGAFQGCDLDKDSVDHILISVKASVEADETNMKDGVLHIHNPDRMAGARSATPSPLGWKAYDYLVSMGWDVKVNGTYTPPDQYIHYCAEGGVEPDPLASNYIEFAPASGVEPT